MKPAMMLALLAVATGVAAQQSDQFTDVTSAAGVSFNHSTNETILNQADFIGLNPNFIDEIPRMSAKGEINSWWMSGGVAVGDYDDDGLPDIFAVGGNTGTARLFRNDGDGTFTDMAAAAGVNVSGERQTGAMFADINGDGYLDLFVGGLVGTVPRMFLNDGDGTFTDIFDTAFIDYDIVQTPNNLGGTFGDYDGDGDLDAFFGHSMTPFGPDPLPDGDDSSQHLWRNNGDNTFTDVSTPAWITAFFNNASPFPDGPYHKDHSFAPNFTDLDQDGHLDVLLVSDHNESRIFMNDGDGTFTDTTDSLMFSGVAGMGAATGDFNNDGLIDWFVSQIHRPDGGNRLYRGNGDGTFDNMVADDDPEETIGIEAGHWGWGACFADLDNDRLLDAFHVNGFYWSGNNFSEDGLYTGNPAVVFFNDGDETFTEAGALVGLDDRNEGRGVSCFDYDRDGDIDIAISNHKGPFKLFRNNLNPDNEGDGFVTIRLEAAAPNVFGVGSVIRLSSSQGPESSPPFLLQEVAVDANFVSSNLLEAHFGVGDWQGSFEAEVTWLDGTVSNHTGILRNTFVTLSPAPPVIPMFEDSFE